MKSAALTRYCCRGSEGSSNVGVQLDIEVLLVLHLFVALFNLNLQPIGEVGAHDGGTDIADPLPADLLDLLVVWNVQVHVLVLRRDEVRDLLD